MINMTVNIPRWLGRLIPAFHVGVILLSLMACSNNSRLDNMTCTVSTPEQKDCQSIPTLIQGTLSLKRNGSFELTGNYASCFQASSVQIAGQYLYTVTPKQIIEMELSAEKIEQDEGTKIDFPRTIAVINLDQNSGEGNFIDIWSDIRTKGLVRQENIPKKLHCKPS